MNIFGYELLKYCIIIKTIDMKEYVELACRTMTFKDYEEDSVHMFRGVFTEVAEVLDIFKKHDAYGRKIDRDDLEEELGDIYWYIAVWSRLLEYDFIESTPQQVVSVDDVLFSMAQRAWSVLNTSHAEYYLQQLLNSADSLCIYLGFDPNVVRVKNIEKLMKRYPNGFSETDAIFNRGDAKETLDGTSN